MAARARRENETFQAYRKSLAQEAKLDKAQRKGSLAWNSRVFGTYVRKVHGPL